MTPIAIPNFENWDMIPCTIKQVIHSLKTKDSSFELGWRATELIQFSILMSLPALGLARGFSNWIIFSLCTFLHLAIYHITRNIGCQVQFLYLFLFFWHWTQSLKLIELGLVAGKSLKKFDLCGLKLQRPSQQSTRNVFRGHLLIYEIRNAKIPLYQNLVYTHPGPGKTDILHCKNNLLNFLQLTCRMLQPSCHPNSTFCTVAVHQCLVESLLEKGWSNNRSFLVLISTTNSPTSGNTTKTEHPQKCTQLPQTHNKINKMNSNSTQSPSAPTITGIDPIILQMTKNEDGQYIFQLKAPKNFIYSSSNAMLNSIQNIARTKVKAMSAHILARYKGAPSNLTMTNLGFFLPFGFIFIGSWWEVSTILSQFFLFLISMNDISILFSSPQTRLRWMAVSAILSDDLSQCYIGSSARHNVHSMLCRRKAMLHQQCPLLNGTHLM
ncbi:hypothetical protein VP01_3443g1 [Puccinia sorghi]|uniref:Uncharacterized protein n=1 Tax=Puccinia sorghi TaxID=27349 RepID=A0A0L6UY51_9BASI|nr:hypothetical protein VP01_3443g1 [Puccinia sorghi]